MKRYRILKYPWHTAHAYELAKVPHDWYYLDCTYREWSLRQRPVPGNVRWVPNHHAVETDVMVLHVDHWTVDEPAKRHLFHAFKDAYSGPKIVINHGCNLVDGCSLEAMADWFAAEGVTDVVMEATGSYWKPVWYVLEERALELKLVNAHHVKILPGRKKCWTRSGWPSCSSTACCEAVSCPPPVI